MIFIFDPSQLTNQPHTSHILRFSTLLPSLMLSFPLPCSPSLSHTLLPSLLLSFPLPYSPSISPTFLPSPLLSFPFSFPLSNSLSLVLQFAPLRVSVKARPVSSSGSKGRQMVASQTARKIMETLGSLSSPLASARKLPMRALPGDTQVHIHVHVYMYSAYTYVQHCVWITAYKQCKNSISHYYPVYAFRIGCNNCC